MKIELDLTENELGFMMCAVSVVDKFLIYATRDDNLGVSSILSIALDTLPRNYTPNEVESLLIKLMPLAPSHITTRFVNVQTEEVIQTPLNPSETN